MLLGALAVVEHLGGENEVRICLYASDIGGNLVLYHSDMKLLKEGCCRKNLRIH